MKLVYGGASIGLMGRLASTALDFGTEVIGVIPKSLTGKEIVHQTLTELHIVETMHDRKSMMATLSDAFIALPGGLGTLEEIFEIWNAIKIGTYKKPLGLLNVDGYFDPLLHFLKHASTEGFISDEQLNLVMVADCPIMLLDKIDSALLSVFPIKQ